MRAHEGTGALSVTGTLDITGLRLDAGAMHISKPIGLRSRIDATITKFSHIRLDALNVEALEGASLIAMLGLSGETNFANGSKDLAVAFNTSNMAILLDRIGLLDERQRTVFREGRVSVKGHLKGRGQDQPVLAQATIDARALRFQPLSGSIPHVFASHGRNRGTERGPDGYQDRQGRHDSGVPREAGWSTNFCGNMADRRVQTRRWHHRRHQRLRYRTACGRIRSISRSRARPVTGQRRGLHHHWIPAVGVSSFAVRKYSDRFGSHVKVKMEGPKRPLFVLSTTWTDTMTRSA